MVAILTERITEGEAYALKSSYFETRRVETNNGSGILTGTKTFCFPDIETLLKVSKAYGGRKCNTAYKELRIPADNELGYEVLEREEIKL
ncbi:MAG: hypothetical protein ACE5J4_00840 [Candidatus Aenigmatarchaeota archaeon]